MTLSVLGSSQVISLAYLQKLLRSGTAAKRLSSHPQLERSSEGLMSPEPAGAGITELERSSQSPEPMLSGFADFACLDRICSSL